MLISSCRKLVPSSSRCRIPLVNRRPLSLKPGNGWVPGVTTLAIESSCDDTSVAVLSIDGKEEDGSMSMRSVTRYHEKITAQSEAYKGIHPVVALESHRANIAGLIRSAIPHLGDAGKPSFVSVTRGPGMRSNLAVGLDVARGLALAWNVPIVGVHHMQAHALTPRLCWSSEKQTRPPYQWRGSQDVTPQFPYLTVLVSGGHTMLLNSKSLSNHDILADTADIALGDCLDKAARLILPEELLKPPYGRALEHFAFPNGHEDYRYVAPADRQTEFQERVTDYGWYLTPVLRESRKMIYSFTGLLTSLDRVMQDITARGETSANPISIEERRELARELMRLAFDHLASRILLYLSTVKKEEVQPTKIVVSGGVASNQYLRHVLRCFLNARDFWEVDLIFPPVELCTDNALMIAWAGMEMYAAGYTTRLNIQPLRKWSMGAASEDGGILGVDGWVHASEQQDVSGIAVPNTKLDIRYPYEPLFESDRDYRSETGGI